MSKLINQSKPWRLLSLFLLIVFVGGCAAGPKIATDLLTQVEINSTPSVANSVAIDVAINPKINNYEKIDDSVKESLEIALKNANIFGSNSSNTYKINANIITASQPAWSFGSFEGKLEINYIVFDETGLKILEKIVYTEAGSDKTYFSGAARHRRSRAVNISKNVLQFIDILQDKLK